tara:strand:+ start:3744 stop:4235 length:492 start_codon:yes stop_codon:yes gene_type:complete
MSYNKTYSEIKQILKDSKRITKVTMLKVAKLAILETLGKERSEGVDVTWDSKLGDDLMLDSLDMVELVMFLEECFGVEIPDEMAGEIVTVGDAIETIKKAKANKGKKKKINVSKYKKAKTPGAPLTEAKQFTEATEARAEKQAKLDKEIDEALEEDERNSQIS